MWRPTLLAAALAGVYLVADPASQDLAAATFRADLFADHGFALWNNAWYDGHYLLSYSVLYPPLGAWLGPQLTAALGAVASAGLFAALARRRFGEAALVPSLWFAVAISAWLLTGRVPFLLAVPFGLAALLALEARRRVASVALAALASLASPVAGLFVALAGAALFVTGRGRDGIALGAGALTPIAVLNLAFPTGGFEPFVFSAFIAIPVLAAVVLWLVPREFAALRVGTVLYALLALVLFIVDNPLGGNVTRLGALFAGPVLALCLWPRGALVVLAVSVPLAYWQLVAPVRDVRKAAGDPSTQRAFYDPLLAELDELGRSVDGGRVHVPPTRNRWEAAYVAREHPLARGWLRQLESDDFDLFTEGELTPAAYRRWLDEHAVGLVAVPDAPRDYLAEDEVELIDGGLDYLREVWSSGDWRLYRVIDPVAIGADVSEPDRFSVTTDAPGIAAPALNYNRYWQADSDAACATDADGRTRVETEAAGTYAFGVALTGAGC